MNLFRALVPFRILRLTLVLMVCPPLVVAQKAPSSAQGDPAHVLARPDDLTWGPAPPKLPPGALFARISGDPSKPGEPYVFRAKLPDGFSMPPHWHPADENITVVKGVMRLGFGTKFDAATLHDLPAGSFALLRKEVPHYNVMKGETIIQLHGIGPYDVTFVDPADDRSRKPATK